MAEELAQDGDIVIERVKGRLGDLRVTLDGEEVFATNRLLFPRSRKVVETVRGKLPL